MDDGRGAQQQPAQHVADAGDVEQGTPMKPTSLLMSGAVVYIALIAWAARLAWVSTAPLGCPVVPEVYMISAGLSLGMSTAGRVAILGHQVLVAQDVPVGRRAGDDDGGQRGRDVTHRGADGGQHRLGDQHGGLAVLHQERQLGRGQPEVDRDRDRADPVGGQGGLDELRPVEHEDHHPVALAPPRAVQRAGQLGDPVVEVGPGRRPTHEPHGGRAGLHQGVPGELIAPVLAAGQIRLLGSRAQLCGHLVLCSVRRHVSA